MTPARDAPSLRKLINELDSAPCKFVASVKCKVNVCKRCFKFWRLCVTLS